MSVFFFHNNLSTLTKTRPNKILYFRLCKQKFNRLLEMFERKGVREVTVRREGASKKRNEEREVRNGRPYNYTVLLDLYFIFGLSLCRHLTTFFSDHLTRSRIVSFCSSKLRS